MTAAALVAAFRRRGVELAVVGAVIRARPAGVLSEGDRAALAEHKAAVVALLTDLATLEQDGTATGLRRGWVTLADVDRAQLRAEAEAGEYSAGLILTAVATSPEPAAWLFYSHRLGLELWLAQDAAAVELIRNELGARPVVFTAELAALRALDTDALRAVLNAKAVFPGARVVPAVPEAQESSR